MKLQNLQKVTWFVNFNILFQVAVKYGKDPRIFSILCKEFVGNSEGHVTAALTVDIEWEMVSIFSSSQD